MSDVSGWIKINVDTKIHS